MEENVVVSVENVDDDGILQMEHVMVESSRELVHCMFEENESMTFEEAVENSSAVSAILEDDEEEGEEVDEDKDDGLETKEKIDKDDPRSRLHFVKYLKRSGKTMKIWECGICSKEFRHQYTLMRHLPTHTDERNFRCDVCGKAFRQMSTLSQHRAIHSDARPYICEICKKTFNRVSTLISHRKTHSEKKPHTCNVCGKGFHQKGNLRNHIFTHTNERPYRCNVCGKGFNQMSNLMCHKVKLCEAEKSILMKRDNEDITMMESEITAVKESTGERRIRNKKNMKFVEYVGDKTEHEPGISCKSEQDEDILSLNAGVLIEPIQTKAMKLARLNGQTPFALLKPAKGIPVLVKVVDVTSRDKQMLVPATAEDLKNAGKVTVSPSAQCESVKAVQIKVPVVATVTQKILVDGSLAIIIEPPNGEHLFKEQAAASGREESTEENVNDLAEREEDCAVEEEAIQYVFADDDGSNRDWVIQDIEEGCIEQTEHLEAQEVYILEEIPTTEDVEEVE
ncbi:zinc finger and BTB domain-containing protein 49-like isoform X2 [Neocloeon triangulifer]|nr:zinc finger and BTB domain-containing protein 49-like isoform X2 [Neocloeon triangulifer]